MRQFPLICPLFEALSNRFDRKFNCHAKPPTKGVNQNPDDLINTGHASVLKSSAPVIREQ